MATNTNPSRVSGTPQNGGPRFTDGEAFAVLGGGMLAMYLAYRFIKQHPALVIAIAIVAAVLATTGSILIGRWRDRRAARQDPPSPGVSLGTVKRDGLLARPRPYRIPWKAFHQHVLIDGPTGAGKTFTFVLPILRAFCAAKKPTGIFYLDGKGDRVDREPGIGFDHVFCPEDPDNSARWNPLAGDDPFAAAAQFAAALFPEAIEAGANFYEAKAVYAISKVVPAMAITGYGIARSAASDAVDLDTLEQTLVAAGIEAERAAHIVDVRPEVALRQLSYRRLDPSRVGPRLTEAIDEDLAPPAGNPRATYHEVTPAALNAVLFGAAGLAPLAEALEPFAQSGDVWAQLHGDVAALAAMDARERTAVLQNLQNRLGMFLTAPFDRLCSRSDFRIGAVATGEKVAFLLPVGQFPTVAGPLGRVALAQFKNAVLASQPGIRKVAVLDEFHNFVSDDWGPFLSQARSRDGAAVMAIQSLADLPPQKQQAMLANARTVIVTPGVSPADAEYWAKVFGEEVRERRSYSYEQQSFLSPRPRAHVQVDQTVEYRWTPSEIAELDPSYALFRVTHGRTIHPVAKVRVERG